MTGEVMSMNVQPDFEFIKAMKEAGGDTLKQCYQCATCSVACPLSTDTQQLSHEGDEFMHSGEFKG